MPSSLRSAQGIAARLLLPILLPALAADLAIAQELRWILPERGAAYYTRELKTETTFDPPRAMYGLPWPGTPGAGVVLAGELDETAQRPAWPPSDVRELLAFLLLDLGRVRGGKVTLDLPGNGRVQPFRLEASHGPLAEDGTQTFEGRLSTALPAEPKGKAAQQPPASPGLPRLQGTFKGSRQVDRTAGRVIALTGELVLEIDYAAYGTGQYAQPARKARAVVHDTWTFERVVQPGDPEFRAMVVDGIRKAVDNLTDVIERQQPQRKVDDPYHDTQPGELALTLLALVKGGADPRREPLAAAYDDLRQREIQATYCLSVAILAMEALYTPAGEWQAMREGRIKAPMPRLLTDSDRALMEKWVAVLLGNIDTTVDAAYLRRWHYGPSKSWDNSNTQYALLGLYGAQLCGIEISPQVWTAAGNHWLKTAMPSGESEFARIVTHADLDRQARGGTRSRGAKVVPCGWSYGNGGQPTGSMTCAGVTGLTLCAAGLRLQKRGAPKLLHDLDDAARGGLLWLQHNLSVRNNPGPGPEKGSDSWYYYYLYGLERTCEFNQVALLGERDWYFEGALQLLGQQRRDGGWGSTSDTCFGLLFLKKTALPALTAGR